MRQNVTFFFAALSMLAMNVGQLHAEAEFVCPHPTESMAEVKAVAPTCTTPGNSQYYECQDCGKFFNDVEAKQATTEAEHLLVALSHNWQNGTCSRCYQQSASHEYATMTFKEQDKRLIVATKEGKYYAMTHDRVAEGYAAVEVSCDEDNYLHSSTDKNLIEFVNYTFVDEDGNYVLNIFDSKLVVTPVKLGSISNRFASDDEPYINNAFFGYDAVSQKDYYVALKETEGQLYFGLKEYSDEADIQFSFMRCNQECDHKSLFHTPASEATCTSRSEIEHYYCDDCGWFFADSTCHQEATGLYEYQPVPAKGHYYADGSNVCTNCGCQASIYRPVTTLDQINPGYNYIMVGHIGNDYYVLSRPTLQLRNMDGMYEGMNPEEITAEDKVYKWDGQKMQAIPVTLNSDGSITADNNSLLEFTLCTNNNIYNETDITKGSPYLLRTPWGVFTDEGEVNIATFECYQLNSTSLSFGPENVYRVFSMPGKDYKFFSWYENYNQLPENIKNITMEANSILMHRQWASVSENEGSFLLAKEEGSTPYFGLVNSFYDDWKEQNNTTATLYATTLYYCASTPMASQNTESGSMTVFADNLDKEGLEDVIEKFVTEPTEKNYSEEKKDDGKIIERVVENKPDGSVETSEKIEYSDGSVGEKSVIEDPDGTIYERKKITSSECAEKIIESVTEHDGAKTTITIERAADGTTTRTNVTVTNSDGTTQAATGLIDLTQVKTVQASAEEIRQVVLSQPTVSKNALVAVSSESGITGTNIINNGNIEKLVIEASYASYADANLTLPKHVKGKDVYVNDSRPDIKDRYETDVEEALKKSKLVADEVKLTLTVSGGAFTRQEMCAAPRRAAKAASSYTWGTVCLPFEIKSSDDVKLYVLKSVTTDGEEGVMTFKEVETVAGAQPCLYRSTGDTVTFTNTNVELYQINDTAFTAVDGWQMKGTFEYTAIKSNLLTSGGTDGINRYYLADDKIRLAEHVTAVRPFRAWFETAQAGNTVKTLRIVAESNGSTAILKIDADGNLEQLPVDAIYDLNGRQLSAPKKGQLNIINGKIVMAN